MGRRPENSKSKNGSSSRSKAVSGSNGGSRSQNEVHSEFFQFPGSNPVRSPARRSPTPRSPSPRSSTPRSPSPRSPTSRYQSHHSQPVHSSGSARSRRVSPAQPVEVDLPDQAKQLLVRVVQAEGAKFPSFVPSASKKITKAFKQMQNKEGVAWKLLPKSVKESYWREFEKSCTWADAAEHTVREAWTRIARKLYSDWQYKNKQRKKMPDWCEPEVWEAWKLAWNTEEAKAKSAIKSANRKGKSGKKPSVHIGGSKSHLEHALEIWKKEGKMPSLLRQFRLMHKKGDKFCDEKSTEINEALERRMIEKVAEAEAAGLDAGTVDENQVFLEVLGELGCIEKGRIYGIGNRASSLSTDGSFNSTAGTPTPPPMTPEQTTELVLKVIRENFDESIHSALQSKLPNLFETMLSQLKSSFNSNQAGGKGNGGGDNNGNADKENESESESDDEDEYMDVDENMSEQEHERNSVYKPVNPDGVGVAFQLNDEDTFVLV